ncbi:MAG: sensor domain-containing diguanylate cyclase [Firmicutes bacterium]|nr:sensor domain-containing diguanylate cyclase [Bacillota bacterium]
MESRSAKSYNKILILFRWVLFVYYAIEILFTGHDGGGGRSIPFSPEYLLAGVGVLYIINTIIAMFSGDRPLQTYIVILLDFLAAFALVAKFGTATLSVAFLLPILKAGHRGTTLSIIMAVLSAVLFAVAKVFPETMSGKAVELNFFISAGFLYVLVFFIFAVLVSYVYEISRKQEYRTNALLSIIEASQELGSTSSLEKVMASVVSIIQSLFKCNTCIIYQRDDEDPEHPLLRVKFSSTSYPQAFSDFNPDAVTSYIGKAVKEKKGIIIADHYSDAAEDIVPKNKAFSSMMVVPLIFENQAMGAILIAFSAPGIYTEENLKLFTLLGSQVALAMRNVQLHEATITLAITDSLSGMFTHGYFQEHLAKEIVKAKYANQPISTMILDVDFFKKVNDTYGHPQGDALLKQLGALIKSVVRPSDVIARYGGDEFTVTMHNTNRIGAVLIAEKIRQAVEEYEFVLGSQIVHISLSGGVASFPEDAETKKELVEKADQALYEAKHKGRNKICFAA